MPFFGFDIPDEGTCLNRSKKQFAEAYAALDLAMPDPEQWSGSAADAYTADTEILQDLASQAGIDARFTRLVGSSIDTELQDIIEHQAWEVQLMRMALAIIVAGLTFSCIPLALAMEACAPRSSLTFQIMMFIAGVSAALGVVITVAVWTSAHARALRNVADKYQELTAQVPVSVPAMPPDTERVAAGSRVPWLVDLTVSAMPASSELAAAPGTSTGVLNTLTGLLGQSQPVKAGLSVVEGGGKAPRPLTPAQRAARPANTRDAENDAAAAPWIPDGVLSAGGDPGNEHREALPIDRTYRSTA